MPKKVSSYEGKQDHIRKLKLPDIESWTNEYPDKDYHIHITTEEFTCICPKTGLPDFATISISYIPDKKCIELKSFKEYLLAYRELGIFHEHVVNRILEDLVHSVKPREMTIEGFFQIRGGVQTTVESSYTAVKKKNNSK